MPLTNVWCRNASGEWTRTTAREAEKYHRYSVSADSRMFRCNSCFQYVTFVKGSAQRISHFRHSSGEIDKKCEDRSIIYSSNSTSTSMLAGIPSPMRISLDGNRVILEVGFLPLGTEELKKVIDANVIVSIYGKHSRPDSYRIDHSRFVPHTMTWLPLCFLLRSNIWGGLFWRTAQL